MAHTFKDIFRKDCSRSLRDVLAERQRLQLKRERATIIKRLPPGHIYFRGRAVEYVNL